MIDKINSFTIGLVIGLFLLSVVAGTQRQAEQQLGLTYKEVNQMKRECEKELPRNKQCVPVLTFKVED